MSLPKNISCITLLLCSFLTACRTAPEIASSGSPELISVKKIWDAGQHNAFTDLIQYRGQWFCTFRESEAHIGGNGKIRLLTSRDGSTWSSAALLSEEGVDLRDPKFSITPAGQLMLVLGGSIYEGKTLRGKQPRVAFSPDGKNWSQPQKVLAEGDWLWRVTWHKKRAYGIVYTTPLQVSSSASSNEWAARLVVSEDGMNFRDLASLKVPNRPNEGTLRFLENGNCVALLRREDGDKSAWIGVSSAPYKDWQWHPAGLFVGGPNFIPLPDGSLIAGGRQMHPPPTGARMFIGKMDLQSVSPQLTLPSGGDCSYPGLVWHRDALWISYYSSHEGRSSIYLAKVKL